MASCSSLCDRRDLVRAWQPLPVLRHGAFRESRQRRPEIWPVVLGWRVRLYWSLLRRFDSGFAVGDERLLRRLGVRPTRSGSTAISALSDSWNVSGCSDIGLAFAI